MHKYEHGIYHILIHQHADIQRDAQTDKYTDVPMIHRYKGSHTNPQTLTRENLSKHEYSDITQTTSRHRDTIMQLKQEDIQTRTHKHTSTQTHKHTDNTWTHNHRDNTWRHYHTDTRTHGRRHTRTQTMKAPHSACWQ